MKKYVQNTLPHPPPPTMTVPTLTHTHTHTHTHIFPLVQVDDSSPSSSSSSDQSMYAVLGAVVAVAAVALVAGLLLVGRRRRLNATEKSVLSKRSERVIKMQSLGVRKHAEKTAEDAVAPAPSGKSLSDANDDGNDSGNSDDDALAAQVPAMMTWQERARRAADGVRPLQDPVLGRKPVHTLDGGVGYNADYKLAPLFHHRRNGSEADNHRDHNDSATDDQLPPGLTWQERARRAAELAAAGSVPVAAQTRHGFWAAAMQGSTLDGGVGYAADYALKPVQRRRRKGAGDDDNDDDDDYDSDGSDPNPGTLPQGMTWQERAQRAAARAAAESGRVDPATQTGFWNSAARGDTVDGGVAYHGDYTMPEFLRGKPAQLRHDHTDDDGSVVVESPVRQVQLTFDEHGFHRSTDGHQTLQSRGAGSAHLPTAPRFTVGVQPHVAGGPRGSPQSTVVDGGVLVAAPLDVQRAITPGVDTSGSEAGSVAGSDGAWKYRHDRRLKRPVKPSKLAGLSKGLRGLLHLKHAAGGHSSPGGSVASAPSPFGTPQSSPTATAGVSNPRPVVPPLAMLQASPALASLAGSPMLNPTAAGSPVDSLAGSSVGTAGASPVASPGSTASAPGARPRRSIHRDAAGSRRNAPMRSSPLTTGRRMSKPKPRRLSAMLPSPTAAAGSSAPSKEDGARAAAGAVE